MVGIACQVGQAVRAPGARDLRLVGVDVGLTFEAWLEDFARSEAARDLFDRAQRRAVKDSKRDACRYARPGAAVATQGWPTKASARPFSVAEVMQRVPNSVFALGGMGDVSPMVTRRGHAEG